MAGPGASNRSVGTAPSLLQTRNDSQLAWAKRIVNAYPAYARDRNYLGDLMVISLAGAMGLTVVTLDNVGATPSLKRPKIPYTCAGFRVACTSVPGFLRDVAHLGNAGSPPREARDDPGRAEELIEVRAADADDAGADLDGA